MSVARASQIYTNTASDVVISARRGWGARRVHGALLSPRHRSGADDFSFKPFAHERELSHTVPGSPKAETAVRLPCSKLAYCRGTYLQYLPR
jgi:hypothetical protein